MYGTDSEAWDKALQKCGRRNRGAERGHSGKSGKRGGNAGTPGNENFPFLYLGVLQMYLYMVNETMDF